MKGLFKKFPEIGCKLVSWYPPHMKKTLTELERMERDVTFELIDARAPFTCFTPNISKDSRHVLVFTKMDLLAKNDKEILREMASRYFPEFQKVYWDISGNPVTLKKEFWKVVQGVDRKFKSIPLVGGVVGIPNTGKSTLINRLNRKKVLVAGDKAGVTTRSRKIRISEKLVLLDTPGVLVPRIANIDQAFRLLLLNALPEKFQDYQSMAEYLIQMRGDQWNVYFEKYLEQYADGKIGQSISSSSVIQQIQEFSGGSYRDCCKKFIDHYRSGIIIPELLDEDPASLQIAPFNKDIWKQMLKNYVDFADFRNPKELPTYYHIYIDAQSIGNSDCNYTVNLVVRKDHNVTNGLLGNIIQDFAIESWPSLKKLHIIFDGIQTESLTNTDTIVHHHTRSKARGKKKKRFLNVSDYSRQIIPPRASLTTIFLTDDIEFAIEIDKLGFSVGNSVDWFKRMQDWNPRPLTELQLTKTEQSLSSWAYIPSNPSLMNYNQTIDQTELEKEINRSL